MKPLGKVVLAKVSDVGSVPLAADVCWLTRASDWSFVADWRKAVRKDRSQSARDAVEYAQLGCKRWRFLFEQDLTVHGLNDFTQTGDPALPAREMGLAIAVTTTALDEQQLVVGFGFLRRSWANRLILEFLAGSPATQGSVKGTGAALMHVFCRVAISIHAAEIWGEATAASCGFYATLKSRIHRSLAPAVRSKGQSPEDISDRFVFNAAEIASYNASGPVKFAD
jgi:hypothetical protein